MFGLGLACMHACAHRALQAGHAHAWDVTLLAFPCRSVRDYRRNNKYVPRTVDLKAPLDLDKVRSWHDAPLKAHASPQLSIALTC